MGNPPSHKPFDTPSASQEIIIAIMQAFINENPHVDFKMQHFIWRGEKVKVTIFQYDALIITLINDVMSINTTFGNEEEFKCLVTNEASLNKMKRDLQKAMDETWKDENDIKRQKVLKKYV